MTSEYIVKLEGLKKDYTIEQLLACVYDLFQNYQIDEDEENELYDFLDPKEEFNFVSDYWMKMDFPNPLMEE